jgi:hypothetical protein
MQLIGYFKGIASELRHRLASGGLVRVARLSRCRTRQWPSDHSTISRTRRLIDLETHRAVFTWVQQWLSAAGLVKGKSLQGRARISRMKSGLVPRAARARIPPTRPRQQATET